jgi:hypothetical protein
MGEAASRRSWCVLVAVLVAVVAALLIHAPGVDAAIRDIGDGCPPGQVPEDGFTDVRPDNVHEAAIDCVAWWEIARGTTETTYTPRRPVKRGEMASFLARLIESAGATFPAAPDVFTDDNGNTHEESINKLASVGIALGVAPGIFRPDAYVSRDQMASLLARAFEALTGVTLPSTRDEFGDDERNVHELNINKIAEAGFTGGTRAGFFSPRIPVYRDAMASFLARMLDKLVEEGYTTLPGAGPRPSLPTPSLPTVPTLPVTIPTVTVPTVTVPTVPGPTVPTIPTIPTLSLP